MGSRCSCLLQVTRLLIDWLRSHTGITVGCLFMSDFTTVCFCTSLCTNFNLTAVSSPNPPAGSLYWPSDIIWDNEEKDTWSSDSLTRLSVCLSAVAISQLAAAPSFFLLFSLLLHNSTIEKPGWRHVSVARGGALNDTIKCLKRHCQEIIVVNIF